MTPQPDSASKWVADAMDLADRVWWADDDAVSYRRADLRECLQTQDALMAQLAGAAKNYAERYCKDEADAEGPEFTGCTQQQHEDAVALFAAVAAYEESK